MDNYDYSCDVQLMVGQRVMQSPGSLRQNEIADNMNSCDLNKKRL